MNWLLFFMLGIVLVLVFGLGKTNVSEHFWSRPNKCFDCEKQITSIQNAHLGFPTKCFDCEKQIARQGGIPYNTGPTKCFDCACKAGTQNFKQTCKNSKPDLAYFSNFARNMRVPWAG